MPNSPTQIPHTSTPIWLYGVGGHAKVVADIITACGMRIAGLIDDDPELVHRSHGTIQAGWKLDPTSAIFSNSVPMILCVGNNRIRKELASRLPNQFITLIHPSASISPSVELGDGTVVMQGAIIQAETEIGNHVIVNTGASVDHENQIADFVHISPQATLSGNVSIGEGSWIGAGASVIQQIQVGPWATVGAGAVIIRDVAADSTVVGNPGKTIEKGSPSQVVIYGFGGFSLELMEYLQLAAHPKLSIVGFVDDAESLLPNVSSNIKFLGNSQTVPFQDDLNWVIAVGNPLARRKMWNSAKDRQAKFLTYIHPTAIVSPSASIGEGSIICPYSIVNANAKIGRNVVVNVNSSIGHGAVVGDHSVLCPYSSLSGDSSLGECSFLGTRATLFPKVVVGNRCTVDSHSFVKQNVADGHLISCRGEYLVVKNRLVDL